MLKLFFGDLLSALTTVVLLAVLTLIVLIAVRRKGIMHWGRRTLVLALAGLILCCLVALRDDYVAALQGRTGFFPLDSVQIYLAYIGGAVIAFSSLSSIFVRNQKYRKVMFFILSGSIIFKAVLIELSRMLIS